MIRKSEDLPGNVFVFYGQDADRCISGRRKGYSGSIL